MHNDFNRNWPLYSWMYNLQNGIQFDTIPTPKTKTATLGTATTCPSISPRFSLCTRLIVTSREFLAGEGECGHYSKCVFHCASEQQKNTRIYIYENENNDLWHKPFPYHCPRKNMLYLSRTLSAWATGQQATSWINADPDLQYCRITNLFQLPAYAIETWNSPFSC